MWLLTCFPTSLVLFLIEDAKLAACRMCNSLGHQGTTEAMVAADAAGIAFTDARSLEVFLIRVKSCPSSQSNFS